MNKYNIINIDSGEIIRTVAELPSELNRNEFPVEVAENHIEKIIAMINAAAEKEIFNGYVVNGVKYGLSITDQLNYNSTASLVNIGAESVVIIGETESEKYYESTFTNDEAKAFLAGMFSYVDQILSKYRAVKRSVISANPDEIQQILDDSGLFAEEIAEQ